MKKIMLLCCCVVFSFMLPSRQALAQEQDAEDFVYAFYHWYGSTYLTEPRQSPLEHDDIYKYVSPVTVLTLRTNYHRGLFEHDYFLKGENFCKKRLAGLKVYDHTKVNDELYLVTAGFLSPNGEDEPFLLVFVQKEKAGWRITKVEAPQEGS